MSNVSGHPKVSGMACDYCAETNQPDLQNHIAANQRCSSVLICHSTFTKEFSAELSLTSVIDKKHQSEQCVQHIQRLVSVKLSKVIHESASSAQSARRITRQGGRHYRFPARPARSSFSHVHRLFLYNFYYYLHCFKPFIST